MESVSDYGVCLNLGCHSNTVRLVACIWWAGSVSSLQAVTWDPASEACIKVPGVRTRARACARRVTGHSLVGGVVVADHLRQDPLFVSVHSFDPSRHLVTLLGHIVTAGWGRSTQRGGAGGGNTHVRKKQHSGPACTSLTPASPHPLSLHLLHLSLPPPLPLWGVRSLPGVTSHL